MLVKEFRIIMPVSVEEYKVGQLYSTIKASKNESGGGDGIEIVEYKKFDDIPLLNGKFHSGQYTSKIYHLESKAPAFLRLIMPKGSLQLHEESWNAYPYCKTVLKNPGYMKENFILIIESIHLSGEASEDNPLEIPPENLHKREIVVIDIAESISERDYNPTEDPTLFKSEKTGRGQLIANEWMKTHKPLMTCYKLVIIECKWLGLQKRIENIIQSCELRLFTVFNRQIFCWIDEWIDLKFQDVRLLEEKAKEELNEVRNCGAVKGLSGGSEEPAHN